MNFGNNGEVVSLELSLLFGINKQTSTNEHFGSHATSCSNLRTYFFILFHTLQAVGTRLYKQDASQHRLYTHTSLTHTRSSFAGWRSCWMDELYSSVFSITVDVMNVWSSGINFLFNLTGLLSSWLWTTCMEVASCERWEFSGGFCLRRKMRSLSDTPWGPGSAEQEGNWAERGSAGAGSLGHTIVKGEATVPWNVYFPFSPEHKNYCSHGWDMGYAKLAGITQKGLESSGLYAMGLQQSCA